MDFSKTLIKKKPFALFLIISFVFSVFFSMTSYTSTQDCDSNEDDLQKRRHALEKYIVTSSDLPGTPNFHLDTHPTAPQNQLLEEILTLFPNINELLLIRTIDPAQDLKTLLQTPNTLKSLRMACTKKGICPIGMEALTSLITQKSLLFLRLSDIPDFDSQRISILAKALSQSCHLQSLTLQDQKECCAEGGLFLAKSLHNQNSLTKLNLNYCNLGNTGISGILNALSYNHCLQTLMINEYTQDDSNPFAVTSSHQNTSLTKLSLHGCCRTLTSLTTLASAFQNHTYLRSFKTAGPFYKPIQCAQILGTFVSTHPSIENFEVFAYNLDLGSFVPNANHGHLKKLNWSHAKDQKNSLPYLLTITSLTHLSLPYNDLRDSCISTFTQALPLCTNLTTLDLSRNHFTREGEELLKKEAQEINPNLLVQFKMK